uniref:Probable nicotinate-nucleotide adenylyltransferase n=1 Tax=Leptospirillum ferriphilum TaxID=178606 RepID=A0A7C3LVX7_9BACT
MPMPKTALFGGAFNPVHLGHIALARFLTDRLDLEKIVFVPVGKPAHRNLPEDPGCPERMKMLGLAISGESRWTLSGFECRSPDVSYTVRTVEALFPEDRPWLILGSDAFFGFDSWFEPERLLERVHLLVAFRPGDTTSRIQAGIDRLSGFGLGPVTLPLSDLSLQPEIVVDSFLQGGRETYFAFVRPGTPDFSSSMVRSAIRQEQPFGEFLPAHVKSYIVEKGLYGASHSRVRSRSGL